MGKFRSRNTRVSVVSALGLGLAALWGGAKFALDAATLSGDANQLWRALMSAPEILPWILAGIFLVGLAWSFWPSDDREDEEDRRTVFNNPSGINIGTVSGGTINHHSHAAEKFRADQSVMTYSHIEHERCLNLANAAKLRLHVPYSATSVTMRLDVVPVDMKVQTSEGVRVARAAISVGSHREFVFDHHNNKRHVIDVGGSVFIVTLVGIEAPAIEGRASALKYNFTVAEK